MLKLYNNIKYWILLWLERRFIYWGKGMWEELILMEGGLIYERFII